MYAAGRVRVRDGVRARRPAALALGGQRRPRSAASGARAPAVTRSALGASRRAAPAIVCELPTSRPNRRRCSRAESCETAPPIGDAAAGRLASSQASCRRRRSQPARCDLARHRAPLRHRRAMPHRYVSSTADRRSSAATAEPLATSAHRPSARSCSTTCHRCRACHVRASARPPTAEPSRAVRHPAAIAARRESPAAQPASARRQAPRASRRSGLIHRLARNLRPTIPRRGRRNKETVSWVPGFQRLLRCWVRSRALRSRARLSPTTATATARSR